MNYINAVIIDDEPDSISLLQLQLSKHCPQIGKVNAYTNTVKALQDIEMLKPDLVFLDIEMPLMNGFEFLEKLMPLSFNVIFITAYNQYALKAFRFSALDYLVKPIDVDDLIEAVNKVEKTIKPTLTQLDLLQKQVHGEPANKIAIPTQNSILFIDLNEIIYGEASNNYTKLILTEGRNLTISKTLKDIQDVLENSHFLRIHRQYIINLNHVNHFNRNESTLTMNNKITIPVARNQKDKLIERYRCL